MAKYNAKLTPEVSEKICDALKKGHSIEAACADAGIVRQTFYNWYDKGQTTKSGKFKQFVCDVDYALDEATRRVEKVILDVIPESPQDAKWWLTKRRPDIYVDRQVNETKIDATIEAEVTVNLFDKVKKKRRELNDLNSR